MNFLLAIAASSILIFYVLGRFVVLNLSAALVPDLLSWIASGYTLAALGLTVLIVARSVANLSPLSFSARTTESGMVSFLGQVMLVLGHVSLVGIAWLFFSRASGEMNWLLCLVALIFYCAGLVVCLKDWRTRVRLRRS